MVELWSNWVGRQFTSGLVSMRAWKKNRYNIMCGQDLRYYQDLRHLNHELRVKITH